jgi:hypothetical protein
MELSLWPMAHGRCRLEVPFVDAVLVAGTDRGGVVHAVGVA